MSTKVLLPTASTGAHYSLVKDIVFDRWINGKRDHSFKLGTFIKRVSAITLDEFATADEVGVEGGTGIYKLAGEVSLAINSGELMNAVNMQDGDRYGMHILYYDGTASSIPYIDTNNVPLQYTGDYQYIADRYPNAAQYQSYFGVRLTVKKTLGGTNRTAILSLSGITMEDVSWTPKNDADFYSRFSL